MLSQFSNTISNKSEIAKECTRMVDETKLDMLRIEFESLSRNQVQHELHAFYKDNLFELVIHEMNNNISQV